MGGAEENVYFLLAAWLPAEKREEGTGSSQSQVPPTPPRRKSYRGRWREARTLQGDPACGGEHLDSLSDVQKSYLSKF